MCEQSEPSSSYIAVRDVGPAISEVSRLATLLAERVLDAQIAIRPVPDSHSRSLLEATVLLREYRQGGCSHS